MLNAYLQQAQRFINDQVARRVNPDDLRSYANRARREVALRSQSIRVLPATSGQIVSAAISAGGTGYTSPTLTISSPDYPSGYAPFPSGAQATGTVRQSGGVITGAEITYGGAGYYQPTLIVTDPTGSGAVLTPNLTWINQTILNQEEYYFQDVDLTPFPGVESIFYVRSISPIYSNWRFSMLRYSFSQYQAYIRQYPFTFTYPAPTVFCQRQQGANGSVLVYPIPSQPCQMEWDCYCLPSDLASDNDAEALPDPWTDAVPYFMAHLAYLEQQDFNAAKYYYEMFEGYMRKYSAWTRPGQAVNPYGRP